MRRLVPLAIALAAAAISLSGCDKARVTPLNPSGPAGCLGCHGGANGDSSGAPPNDLAGSQTGGAIGAHAAHLAGRQVTCEECHKVPARIAEAGHIVKADGTPDGDGRAEVIFGARATQGGLFSASFNPSPAPGKGGSCTVYCHGASLGAAGGSMSGARSGNVIAPSPTWGSTGFTCGSCHGDATVNPANPNTTGAPPDHAPGLLPTACASCHPDTVLADGTINTATGAHINGTVEAQGCTGCHGDAARGETVAQAAWAPPRDSTGATTGAKVGAHLRHVSTVASLGSRISKRFACSECHKIPVSAGPHGQPVIQWATGTNDIVNTGGLSPSYAGGSCSSTWCHGAGLSGGSNTTPSWTATTAGSCGSCHFIANPPAPHPASDQVGVAITQATQCAQCHPGTVSAGGTINVTGGMHVNGRIDTDVHPPGYSDPAIHGPQALQGLAACKTCHGPAFGGVGSTPSCTACHAAAGHATWLTECTFCHGDGNRAADAAFALAGNPPLRANQAAPPIGTQRELTSSSPAVGAHLAHINPASSSNGALAIQIQCTECHGAVLPTNADHADGSVAIGWGSIATARAAVPTPAAGNLLASWEANPTCTNYCHGITLAGGGSKVNPNWVNGPPEAACGTCHSALRPGTWHPSNATCGQCHPGYTSSSVNVTTHVNGQIDPAATSCSSCHGGQAGNAAPPYATTGATTGPKVGAHQAHVSAGTLVSAGYACATCHVSPATMRHANDQVDMAWTGAAVAAGVVPTPSAGALAVGAWEAAPTCTNYCHGASLTAAGGANRNPNWTAGVGQVACGSCHAAPPPLSALANQNHPRNAACANCHGAGYDQAAVTGAARTTHVNGSTTLVVGGCTACHGDRAAAGVTLTNNLVAAAPGEGALATSGDTTGSSALSAPGVGAHAAHLSNTTYRANLLTCTDCHALPATNGDVAHATGAGTGGARATLTWGPLARGAGVAFSNEVAAPAYSGSGSAAYGAAAGSCASTYCHGQFKNGGKAVVSWTATGGLTCNSCHGAGTGASATLPGGSHPQSNTDCSVCHAGYTRTTVNKATHLNGVLEVSVAGCTSCHGDALRGPLPGADTLVNAAPPVDILGASAGNKVGAHLAHVFQGSAPAFSSPLACGNCHVVPSSSGPHGYALVTWGGLSIIGGASPSYDLVTQTCSSTYCHGSFTGGSGANPIGWGNGAITKLGCSACHGDPPARPHPQNLGCATCHVGYTTTTAAVATHVDGVVSKITSGCTSCHGELPAAGVTLTSNLVAAAPGATGTNTMDTTGQLAATSAGVGAHKAHLGAGVMAHVAIACTECHALPTSNTDTGHAVGPGTNGARATITWGATATRSVNAWSGAPVVPAYNGSTTAAGGTTGGSCASTYCHGNFTNGRGAAGVAWATPGAMTCNSCHGATAGASASLPGGTHPQGNATCSVCHSGYTNTTASPTLHLNGRLDVVAQNCTGCHGDPARVPVPTATVLDANGQNLARSAPPVGVTAGNQIGAHLAHVNQGASGTPLSSAQACLACHVVPTSGSHSDGVTTVAFGDIAINAGASPTYDSVTHGCSATYCHGQFPGGIQSNTVAWGTGSTAGTKLGCAACHGAPPAHPHPSNATCATCHSGYTAATVAVATHVDGAVNKSTSGCTSCHGELPAAGVTLTNNLAAAAPGATGTNTLDTAGLSGITTSAGTGAHKAHLVSTTYRAALVCTECHALPVSITDTTHGASGAGTGGARATLTWGSLARGVGAAFNNELVAPAYAGSQTGAFTNTAGGCASTYCHGQFKNGKKATVAWTAAPGLTCNSCHGAGTGATATLPPGSHPQGSTACGNCHTGYTGTTVNAAVHMNGALDVIPMTCTSCHGDSARTAAGSATELDALGANLAKAAPPVDATGAASGNQVGAHLAHVNQGSAPALSNALRCVNCHNGLVPTVAPHAPAANPVAFGNLAVADGAAPLAYNTANRNCSNTYCHGQFPYGQNGKTVNWGTGTPAKLACNACHGQSVAAPQPARPHPQNTACAACHTGYTVTTVAAATHVDGLTTRSTSGCTACHGELPLAGVTLTTSLAAAAPGATGTNTVDTTGQTATTAAGVGVHRVHLTTGTIRSALLCTECHALPASNTDVTHANSGAGTGGARATLTFGPLATRSTNAWSGAPVTPSYSGSTTGAAGTTGGSCASTYCHGNFTNGAAAAPAWTASGTITCNSCHGRTAGATASPPGGTHPNSATCGNCHTGYTGTTVNLATHINGLLEVVPQTCTSCHGDSARTAVGSATDLDALGANLAKAAPPVDATGAASGNQVGAHLMHVNQGSTAPALSNALRCVNCHNGLVPTVAPHAPAANPVAFGNLAVADGAAPLAYNTANRNCSNTYCHGQFPYGQNGKTVNWGTGTPAKLACNACHGQSVAAPQPTYPHPQNLTCNNCHVGYTATTVAAATHVDGLTTRSTGGCTACHGDRADVAVTLTTNAFKSAPGATAALTSADTTGATATTAAGVGAHRAHLVGSAGTPRWRSTAIACVECHALPATNTDTAHATGTGTGGARATMAWGNLANGAGTMTPAYTTPTCSSTFCHAPHADTAAGLTLAPLWTGATTAAACGSCHGLPPVTAQHPAGAAACSNCHDGYADAPTTASTGTAVSMVNHINGVTNVTMSCTSCHGTLGRVSVAGADALQPVAPPIAATNALATGAHLAHVNQGSTAPALSGPLACVNCHTGMIYTTTPHTYPANPVAWGNLAVTGPVTPLAYVPATQTCSNTYCHGQFTGGKTGNSITWNPTGKLACTACHGQGTTASQPTYPHPQNTTCASCHAGTTSTTVTAATHVNGTVNKTTAGCTACHGERADVAVTPTVNLVKSAPGATGTATTADTTGATATTAAGVGAHRAHLVGSAGTPRWRSAVLACTECHLVPALATDTAHATGTSPVAGVRATMTWGPLAASTALGARTVSYAPATGCAATYCHAPRADVTAGLDQSPLWTGAATAAACGSCHGLPPVANGHSASTLCSSCHDGYADAPTTASTGTAVSMVNHINGLVDVKPMSCTSCHGTLGRVSVAGADALQPVAPPIAATNALATGAHLAHVNQGSTAPALSGPLACVNCHTGMIYTTTPHTYPANPVAWGNLAVTGPVTPLAYVPATQTCSNTYCHGQFTGGKTGNSITWNPTGKLLCNACHGQGTTASQPTYPHPQNTTCATCHAGATSTTVAAATHVNGTLDRVTSGCTACHGELNAAGVTLTAGLVKSAPGASLSANSYDTTGLTSGGVAIGAHEAHLVGAGAGSTPRWRSTAIACIECHALPATNTDTAHATGVGTGGARATMAWGNLAQDNAFEVKTAAYAQPTCSSVYCHDPKSTDTAAGQNNAPLWTGATTTVVCGSCHGLPPVTAAHPTGVTECASCHGGGYATTMPTSASTIAQVNALLHINGVLDGGGDCTGCHDTAQTMAAGGTRRAIVPEFANAWSHKRSASPTGTVTKWDCVVCHMEGDPVTGNTTNVHKDGVINLRDPDTGNNIQGVNFTAASGASPGGYVTTATNMVFTRFSRNLAVTLEADPAAATLQAIMINQCLKCHDSNGAMSASARVPVSVMPNSSSAKPFGTTIAGATYTGAGVTANGILGAVVDVNESFKTTNSSYHPVTGKQNNWYAKLTRMVAPWNAATRGATVDATSWGPLLSCWDCHAPAGTASTVTLTATVTAHGGATTLRGTATAAGTPSATTGVKLCIICHTGYDTSTIVSHGPNSAWSSTGADSGMNNYIHYGCNACHSSGYSTAVSRPIRAQDVHGVNVLPTGGAAPQAGSRWAGASVGTPAQVDARPYAFIRNTTQLINHQPAKIGGSTYSPTCRGTASPCSNSMGNYTVGGTY